MIFPFCPWLLVSMDDWFSWKILLHGSRGTRPNENYGESERRVCSVN